MRRRRKERLPEGSGPLGTPGQGPHRSEAVPDELRATGPWDLSERQVSEEPARLDLGGLLIASAPGVEVRLQVDETSQEVVAVMLVSQDGALELRPFAAPRHEDTWEDIRQRIAADAAARGGTATPVDGPYGPALQLVLSGTDEQGRTVTQQSVVWGIKGPRWLLRATAFGRPAHSWDEQGGLEQALREVVVVRGSDPMPPGEPLPLKLPPDARPAPQQ